MAACMALILVLTGCQAGGSEFELYRQSYALQFTEGERVVERLGSAERKLWRKAARPSPRSFDPGEARYYVDVGDPPLAGSVRASLVALREYNDLLADLANGNAGTRLVTGVGSILGNLNVARLQLSSAELGPAHVTAAAQILSPPVLTVINLLARKAAENSFGAQLGAAYPHMRRILEGLKEITPTMQQIMVASDADARGNLTTPQQAEADRKMLASWVILIDSTLAAMDAAHNAVQQKSAISLTALTDASIEVRVLAEQIRANRMKPE